jgi:hypothetical protein
MNIEIQAVQKGTLSYKNYTYENIKSVDKYLKMHNNELEFVATYKVMTDDYASSTRDVFSQYKKA